jgi:hypothetical protein
MRYLILSMLLGACGREEAAQAPPVTYYIDEQISVVIAPSGSCEVVYASDDASTPPPGKHKGKKK